MGPVDYHFEKNICIKIEISLSLSHEYSYGPSKINQKYPSCKLRTSTQPKLTASTLLHKPLSRYSLPLFFCVCIAKLLAMLVILFHK